MTNLLLNTEELSQSLLQSAPSGLVPQEVPLDTSVSGSVSGALFRRENMVGSFLEKRSLKSELDKISQDPEYDYFDNVPADLDAYRDSFVSTTSFEARDVVAAKIRRELSDQATLADNPVSSFFLGVVISNLDPSLLLPGGLLYKTANINYGLAKSALAVGLASGVQASLQEAALIQSQETRQAAESVFNVFAATLLGSVAGGIGGAVMGGAIGKQAQADIVETYAQGLGPPRSRDAGAMEVNTDYLKQSEQLAGLGRFVGAAASRLTPMNRLMASPFLAARQFVDTMYEHNLLKNKNVGDGGVANPRNVETEMKVQFGSVEKSLMDFQDIFLKQAGVSTGPLKGVRGALSRQGLKFDDFDFEVSRAMQNNDQHPNAAVQQAAQLLRKKIYDPLTQQAIELDLLPANVSPKTASSYFTRAYNRQAIRENEAGFKAAIIPWLTQKNAQRIELTPIIDAHREQMKTISDQLKKGLAAQVELTRLQGKEVPSATDLKRIESLKKRIVDQEQLKKTQNDLNDDFNRSIAFDLKDSTGSIRPVVDDAQIDSIAKQIIDNILGRNETKILNPILSKFGQGGRVSPLKNRVFLIPDELIRDWTLNSASRVTELYAKAMIPTIELNRLARRLSLPNQRQKATVELQIRREAIADAIDKRQGLGESADLTSQLVELDEKIAALDKPPTVGEAQGVLHLELKQELDRAKEGQTKSVSAKLEKDYAAAVKDIDATFQLMQGVYGAGPNILGGGASKLAKNLKTWNFVRLMGLMTISSLPDIGMHVMRHGPMAFIRDGLVPILRNLDGAKLNKNLLQDLGRAIESFKGNRLKSFLDHDGTDLEIGLFGRALDFSAQALGNFSLMNQWQDLNQFLAGNISISRTLRAIDNWSKTGKMVTAERERFNLLGIGDTHWPQIHKEWQRTGGIENGSYFSDYGNWNLSDKATSEAFSIFKQALLKDVDSTVILPGLGDKPLFARESAGGFLLQFKSFLLAATDRVLVAGLSRNDANFYMGVVSMLGLGTLSYIISSKIRKPDDAVDLSFNKLSKEAIDRSGLLGIFMEGFNISEKLLGRDGVSKYQSRGVLGAFLGPTAGAAEEVAYILNKMSRSSIDEEVAFTTKDAEKFMRLMPYQNLFYLYDINRKVTKKTALGLGFEETE